jgi:hypothetical protein
MNTGREGSRPRGRPRRGQEDSVITDLKERGWQVVGWIHLAWGENKCQVLMNTVKNFRGSVKCWQFFQQLRSR